MTSVRSVLRLPDGNGSFASFRQFLRALVGSADRKPTGQRLVGIQTKGALQFGVFENGPRKGDGAEAQRVDGQQELGDGGAGRQLLFHGGNAMVRIDASDKGDEHRAFEGFGARALHFFIVITETNGGCLKQIGQVGAIFFSNQNKSEGNQRAVIGGSQSGLSGQFERFKIGNGLRQMFGFDGASRQESFKDRIHFRSFVRYK